MTRCLISFDEGAMTFPEEEEASVVATDGTVTDSPNSESKVHLGGFAVVDVPPREVALEWAAKIAVACRRAQEVREFPAGPGRLIEGGPLTLEKDLPWAARSDRVSRVR